MYFDNAKTFVSGSKWIEQVMKDEKISGFLTQQGLSGNSISILRPGGEPI